MDAPTVTIGAVEATLERGTMLAAISLNIDPDGPHARDSAVALAMGAAALRICWPESVAWPTRKRPRAWQLGASMMDYGAPIFEDLYAGVDMDFAALIQGLTTAREWAAASVVRESEVKAAEDFSDAPEVPGG